jgi:hypothetical protein
MHARLERLEAIAARRYPPAEAADRKAERDALDRLPAAVLREMIDALERWEAAQRARGVDAPGAPESFDDLDLSPETRAAYEELGW